MNPLRVLLLLLVLGALTLILQPDDAVTISFVKQADADRATFLYRRAREHAQLALIRQPWNVSAQLRFAALALDQRRFAEVPALIEQARALGADPIELTALDAELAEKTGRFETAALLWSQLAPIDPSVYPRVIGAYLQAEQWNEARAAAEQWLNAQPDRVEARLAVAKIMAPDDPAAARDQLAQVPIEQARWWWPALDEPDPALRSMLLGRAYLSNNDLTLAKHAFEVALQANPVYAEAYAYAGFTLDQLGGDGANPLDRAVEIDRELVVARYFRARHARARGDLDHALIDLQIAIERDPRNSLVTAELGHVYMQRGDLAAAEKWLIAARDLKADDPLSWKALAELYAGRNYGSRQQALVVAQQAAAMAPADAETHVWLGVAHLLSGQRDVAEAEFKRAEGLNPRLALAQLYLGRLYGRDSEPGRWAYERAIALDPAGAIGAQAQRTLALP